MYPRNRRTLTIRLEKAKKKLIKAGGRIVCLKRKIATKKEAQSRLKLARKYGLKEIYKCRICDSWHLTSQRESDRRPRTN